MAVEESQLSNSGYATRRKELLSLVKQLRAIGAQADLDLPRIAVIGNQSAGKSSVVEAISGINVPRDAGTCTRCPMECRLSSSTGPWSCQISIRWEFDDSGKRKDEVHEVPFGGTIKDKGDVELALRRAQAAVLNPHNPPNKYLMQTLEELKAEPTSTQGVLAGGKTLSFSKNVVCVDLVGPELTDLSFIDLPGIIQNAEPEVVKLVEDLVVSHIRGNCLILVALPMTDDIENQKALRLAHQEDPAGRRTIGVMTKPDMLTSGATKARDLWLDVIEGRRHPLNHGYYCTRQPDDAERTKGISSAEARAAETKFFSKTSPWSTAKHQDRFGTTNLVATLSKLLTQIINDTLPNLQISTQTNLEDTHKHLSELPKPIEAEPATFLLSLITELCSEVHRFVEGGIDCGELIHQNRDAFRDFKMAIRRTAPNFMPFPGPSDKDDDFENYLGEGEDEGPGEGLVSGAHPFYLGDMRKHIERSITRELPDDVPFPCKVALINSYQSTWEQSARMCFNHVREDTLKILLDSVKNKFQRYDILQSHLRGFLVELVNRHYESCLSQVESILEIERAPFTQNGHYYDTCKDKWLSKYKDARAGKTTRSAFDRPIKRAKTTSTAPPANGTNGVERAPVPQAPSNPQPAPAPSPFSFANPNTSGTAQSSKNTVNGAPAASANMFGSKPSPFFGTPPNSSNPAGSAFGGFGQPAKPSDAASATPTANGTTSLPPRPQLPIPLVTPPVYTPTSQPHLFSIFGPSAQFHIPALNADSEDVKAVLAGLTKLGYMGITVEDLGKLNPPDVYSRELNVMAQVRAYFQVSYKRVIDNVPLIIDLKFVKAIAKDLQPFLIGKLGLGTPNASVRCGSYLAEDPQLIAKRDELVARKKRLESVALELYNFGL